MNGLLNLTCTNGSCGICPRCEHERPLSYFNNESENLEILAEEAAEVIEQLMIKHLTRVLRLKSKINRFGIDDYHPKNKKPNRGALTEELGHVLAMIDILVENGTIDRDGLEKYKRAKIEKLPVWYTLLED